MRVLPPARRLAAATGLAVGLTGGGLAAAHADSQPPTVSAASISPVLAPGTSGKVIQQPIEATAASATTLTGVTVTYDVTGLAGVATLSPQGKCATSGNLITCHLSDLDVSSFVEPGQQEPYTGQELQPLKLVPVAGAKAGASGSYTATVSAAQVTTPLPATIQVSLADGPDLQVKGSAQLSFFPTVQVSAGSAYYHSLKFTNVGNQAAQGVTVEIGADGHGIDVPELHKNCQYAAPNTASCYIPDLIAPGATETLSPSVEVLTTTDLMRQGLTITVVPGYASLTSYTVGTGKPFTLTDASGAGQQPVTGQTTQSNIDFVDSSLGFLLNVAGATADLAATANVNLGDVPGQWSVGLTPFNNGPGTIELGRSAEHTVTGDVVFPAGVAVLDVPSSWQQVPNSTPGATEYRFNTENFEILAGSGLFSVPAVVVQPQPGFNGGNGTFTVGINNLPPSAFGGVFGDIDSDPSNDTTSFAIPAFGS